MNADVLFCENAQRPETVQPYFVCLIISVVCNSTYLGQSKTDSGLYVDSKTTEKRKKRYECRCLGFRERTESRNCSALVRVSYNFYCVQFHIFRAKQDRFWTLCRLENHEKTGKKEGMQMFWFPRTHRVQKLFSPSL